MRRFPRREVAIRRFYACDPRFREVCDDYTEVQCALQHWQAAGQPRKVAEYREMLEELEAEALARLKACAGG
ncbi:MAG: hypothetical protein R3D25_10230 [Geminicoccaceae bacterium]